MVVVVGGGGGVARVRGLDWGEMEGEKQILTEL